MCSLYHPAVLTSLDMNMGELRIGGTPREDGKGEFRKLFTRRVRVRIPVRVRKGGGMLELMVCPEALTGRRVGATGVYAVP